MRSRAEAAVRFVDACRLVPDRDVNAAVNLARHTARDPKSPPPQAVAA